MKELIMKKFGNIQKKELLKLFTELFNESIQCHVDERECKTCISPDGKKIDSTNCRKFIIECISIIFGFLISFLEKENEK